MKKAANQPKCFAQPGREGSTDPQRFSGASLKPASFWSETLQVSFEKQSWSQDLSRSSMSGNATLGVKNWPGASVCRLRDVMPCVAATLVLLLSWVEVSPQILLGPWGLQDVRAGQDGGCWGSSPHSRDTLGGKHRERDVLAQPTWDHRCCSPRAEPPPATHYDSVRAQAAA